MCLDNMYICESIVSMLQLSEQYFHNVIVFAVHSSMLWIYYNYTNCVHSIIICTSPVLYIHVQFV